MLGKSRLIILLNMRLLEVERMGIFRSKLCTFISYCLNFSCWGLTIHWTNRHNTHLAIPYSTSDTPSPFPLPQHRMHSDTCIFTPKLNFSFSFDHSGLLLLRFNTGALRFPEVVNLHILQFIVEFDEMDIYDIGSGDEDEETVEEEKHPQHIKRLICHLGTAQYQRRCLGFSDHSIYGVAVSRGVARAYVAWWEVTSGDDKVSSPPSHFEPWCMNFTMRRISLEFMFTKSLYSTWLNHSKLFDSLYSFFSSRKILSTLR